MSIPELWHEEEGAEGGDHVITLAVKYAHENIMSFYVSRQNDIVTGQDDSLPLKSAIPSRLHPIWK